MTTSLLDTIVEYEHRLLGTWTRRPSLRAAWTPDPSQCATVRTQAVAQACASVAGMMGIDLGPALVSSLSSSGQLSSLWKLGEPVVSLQDSRDPLAELVRLRELRSLYRLHSQLTRTLLQISYQSDLGSVRSQVQESLAASEVTSGAPAYSDQELMSLALKASSAGHMSGMATGFPMLDDLVGGLRAGHVWILGAPTNWGKSSASLAILDHCLGLGRPALMVSCEDAPELLGQRLLARRASIRGIAARDGKLYPDELRRAEDVVQAAASRGDAPILLDGRGRDVEHLCGDIRLAIRSHGVQVVFVDYLQCIQCSAKVQDRRHQINHITRCLTDVIKTSGAAGVITSQITDESIRDSRDVENGAEVVLIGRQSEDGELSMYVKKNKTGPKNRSVPMLWDDHTGAFQTQQQSTQTSEYDDLCEGMDDVL